MKPKILFVDDDEFIRKIYNDRLSVSGFEVVTSDSVEDAMVKLEHNTYDLICLDHLLGTKSGLDLLNWLRKVKNITIPVLVFSASSSEKNIQEFMNTGATEYIQKDHVVPTELVEKIKKYTAHSS